MHAPLIISTCLSVSNLFLRWGAHPHLHKWVYGDRVSRLRRLNMDSRIICNFYRCTIKSILTGCITTQYGICSVLNIKALEGGENGSEHRQDGAAFHGGPLHTMPRVSRIIKISPTTLVTNCSGCHPADCTTRLRDSFIPQTIRHGTPELWHTLTLYHIRIHWHYMCFMLYILLYFLHFLIHVDFLFILLSLLKGTWDPRKSFTVIFAHMTIKSLNLNFLDVVIMADSTCIHLKSVSKVHE